MPKRRILTKEQVLKDLFSNIEIKANGCWQWTSYCRGNARSFKYPVRKYTNKGYAFHRLVAWVFHKMDMTSKQVVCHTCDNTLCVNPEHLVVADQKWNVRDMWAKGRSSRLGSQNNRTNLTEENVLEIKKLLKEGLPHKEIAEKFKIKRTVVSAINTGQNWGHVN